MSEVENSDFFGSKIFENLIRQGKNYLFAAYDLQNKEKAVIYLDGTFKEVNDFEELIDLLHDMQADMNKFLLTVSSYDDFKYNGIKIIDRYLFDTKNIDNIKTQKLAVQIVGSDEFKHKYKELLPTWADGIGFVEEHEIDTAYYIDKEADIPDVILVEQGHSYLVDRFLYERHKQFKRFYQDLRDQINNLQGQGKDIPSQLQKAYDRVAAYLRHHPTRVVVRESGSARDRGAVQQIKYDIEWVDDENPHETMLLIKDLAYTREHSPDIRFDEANFEAYEKETFAMRQNPYELNTSNRDTLALIEEKTADTTQALSRLFKKISENGYQTVLDLGTGEGRIGIPLAMKGVDILGIDQVPAEWEKIKQRAKKETARTKDSGYSWRHMEELIKRGELSETELTFDIDRILAHYQTKQGNFFELDNILADEPEKKFDMAVFT